MHGSIFVNFIFRNVSWCITVFRQIREFLAFLPHFPSVPTRANLDNIN